MTSALTDSGNGKVVVRRGSIVVDSGNAAAIIVTGNGSVQAAQIDVAGGDRTSGNGKISGAVQTRHASLTGLLSSIPCARRSDTPVDVTDASWRTTKLSSGGLLKRKPTKNNIEAAVCCSRWFGGLAGDRGRSTDPGHG